MVNVKCVDKSGKKCEGENSIERERTLSESGRKLAPDHDKMSFLHDGPSNLDSPGRKTLPYHT